MASRYQVVLAQAAQDDLVSIWDYVAARDGHPRADDVLARLQSGCRRLQRLPRRGHPPPELQHLGFTGFLELSESPFRIVYEIRERKVPVHAILDGRRDLQDLLLQRLLLR